MKNPTRFPLWLAGIFLPTSKITFYRTTMRVIDINSRKTKQGRSSSNSSSIEKQQKKVRLENDYSAAGTTHTHKLCIEMCLFLLTALWLWYLLCKRLRSFSHSMRCRRRTTRRNAAWSACRHPRISILSKVFCPGHWCCLVCLKDFL